ncbi:MAG: LysR family transcriptional regulator [Alteromonadaceae bacterium]|nr:LysR family transcriptional regulator [Alteromonadaceae bacterium]
MDRIEAMRAFVTVARSGSFSAAAEKLDKSPQLVSKYVSQLENYLASRLLNRTTRRVHLTEAGQQYLLRASQVLEEIDSMENDLNAMQQQANGLLRISAPVAFSTQHLAPLMSAFQQQYPDVNIDLNLSDRKVDIIEEGFDIALRIGHLKSSSLIAKPLTPIRLVMCAAPSYLAKYGELHNLDELKTHRYLRYSYIDETNSPAPHSLLAEGQNMHNAALSCNHGELLTQSAVLGHGIVLQPTFICYKALEQGKLKRIMRNHEPPPMKLYALYAHRQLLASKVRAFINFAADFYGDQPYWDACLTTPN